MENTNPTSKLLASIDFGAILSESIDLNQTQTGRNILERYLSHTMNNPTSCKLINDFIKEAKQHLYDNGVKRVFENISETLANNQYSWALLSVCESINKNTSKYNLFNRTACNQVNTLLEGRDEQEVVKYIKAGALKNVMFVEAIRNVVKGIYKEQPVIIETQNFKVEHPISFIEMQNEKINFMMNNRVFMLDKQGNIYESHSVNDTTSDFKFINEMLNLMNYDNDTFSYTLKGNNGDIEYQISEAGIVNKLINNEENEMTVEECRENNRLFLKTVMPNKLGNTARILESVCKIAENYDNIVLLDNVSLIESRGNLFSVVEGENVVTLSLHKSNSQMPFTKTYSSILEALREIKSNFKIDLTMVFEDRIDRELKANQIQERQIVEESIKQNTKQTRANRIAALTETYKNDPATLAVLAALSAELN